MDRIDEPAEIAARVKALEMFAMMMAAHVPREARENIYGDMLLRHQEANPPERWRYYLEKLFEGSL